MNQSMAAGEPGWQPRPLCCRYLVVFTEVLSLTVSAAGVARGQTGRWALGLLADGRYEVLGIWLHPASSTTSWHELFEDLKVRGVEKVRFVASHEPMDVYAALRAAYPNATVLPSTGRLLRQSLTLAEPRRRGSGAEALGGLCTAPTAHAAGAALTALAASPWGERNPIVVEQWRIAVALLEPFYALAPRLRRLFLAGDQVAEQVGRTLRREVARRGCFPAETAAVAFVSEVLDRMNRDFGAAVSVASRGGSNHVRRPGVSSAPADCH